MRYFTVTSVLVILFCLTSIITVSAQKDYFQQEVNYKINVKLDTTRHWLQGHIDIEYINHSPDVLDKIYMHLWPNAYSSQQTAYAKDALKRRKTPFHFAKESEYGYIDSLDFRVNGEEVLWKLDGGSKDIALLILKHDLKSGDSINISTPFEVKVPSSFSRMGREEMAYQITQWYPKPAVYDRKGWHPMSYLAIGEFYSEFGDYEVKIELPTNFKIGTTGQLLSESTSVDGTVIRTFTAQKVHDFAWFADPDFDVETKSIRLVSGKEIEIEIFTTEVQKDLWADAMQYTEDALRFFSNEIGDYPYESLRIIQAPGQAGGGMEYPTIIVIDRVTDAQELDHVIAHEIGHQWFYGILGFNERDHPWMDEGLTTYYDHRYIWEKYKDDHFSNYLPAFLKRNLETPILHYAAQAQLSRRYTQSLNTTSEDLNLINYGLNGYVRPSLAFKYLEKYLGTEEMDRMIQGFYEVWKFKHPQPEDMADYFAQNTSMDVSWFFQDLLTTNDKMDYSISDIVESDGDLKVIVKNKSGLSIPFLLQGIKDDRVVAEQWVQGFDNKKEVDFQKGDYDQISIDYDQISPDINPRNNHMKTSGLFRKWERPVLKLGTGVQSGKSERIYIVPSIVYNAYDGLMLGGMMYSSFIQPQKFQYGLSLSYGLGSKSVVGSLQGRYNIYLDDSRPKHLHFDLGWRKYAFAENEIFNYKLQYWKAEPSINYSWKSSFKSSFRNWLSYKLNIVRPETADFDAGEFVGKLSKTNFNHQLKYTLEKQNVLFPYSVETLLEYQNYENILSQKEHYLQASVTFDSKYQFAQHKYLGLRVFAAKNVINSQRDIGSVNPSLVLGSIALAYQGYNDYFENSFIGRSDQSGLWSRQFLTKEGGFKNALSSQFANIGQSNDYAISMNLKVDLPIVLPKFLPVKAYFDYGLYNAKSTTNSPFVRKSLYSGGLALEYGDGFFGVYFPLVNSTDISSAYSTLGGYGNRISFTLDFAKLQAWNIFDRFGW